MNYRYSGPHSHYREFPIFRPDCLALQLLLYFSQLRCGWRPGHITTTVLRKMTANRGKCGMCTATCLGTCNDPDIKPCGLPPKCPTVAQQARRNDGGQQQSRSRLPSHVSIHNNASTKANRNTANASNADPSKADTSTVGPDRVEPNRANPNRADPNKADTCRFEPCCAEGVSTPYLRVIRHAGKYSIVTDPPDNSPSGPYPLKYVLNCDPNDIDEGVKFSLEAKYNDYCFDYTSSKTSFVLDFSPPDQGCYKPYPKDLCAPCTPGCLMPC